MLNIFKPEVIPNVELIELENVCRICLHSARNMVSLFNNEIDSLISEFLPQKLHRKPLQPHQICATCLGEARKAYIFKKQCQYADEIIKSVLDEPNISKIYEKQIQTDISSFIYSCEKCERKFVSSEILKEHRLNEHCNTLNICRICDKIFSRSFTLRDHLISVHPELDSKNNHKCYLCDNFFQKKQLKMHLYKVHNVNEYFEAKDDINWAIEEDTLVKIGKNEFSCENCLENFQVEDDLKNHECTTFLYKKILDRNSSNWLQLINDCDFKNKIEIFPASEENNECNSVFVDNLKTNYEYEENTVEKNEDEILAPEIEINTEKLYAEELKVAQEIFGTVITKPKRKVARETNTNSKPKPFDSIMLPSKSLTTKDQKPLRVCRKISYSTDKKKCKKKLFSCKICMKKFISKKSLQKHITVIHNRTKEYSCKYCLEKIIGEIEYKRHYNGSCTAIAQAKRHLCSECGASFKDQHHLKRHIRKHTGEKPFKCEYCDRAFSVSANLNRHKKMHTGEKTYHCTICPKSFIQCASFEIHMRTHTGERPFKCSHCPMAFKDNPALKQHNKMHTGERSYCDLCGLSYGTSITLLNHKRRVHGIDKTTKFSCKICSEKFLGIIEYKKHCKVHYIPREKSQAKSYSCSECESSFKNNQRLELHIRTHTGEKPFICEYCDTGFATPSNLKRHTKIHTGEQNYQCTDCPKTFSHSNSFKSHMRTHTGAVNEM